LSARELRGGGQPEQRAWRTAHAQDGEVIARTDKGDFRRVLAALKEDPDGRLRFTAKHESVGITERGLTLRSFNNLENVLVSDDVAGRRDCEARTRRISALKDRATARPGGRELESDDD
jgi:hypothetical protein